MLSLGFCSWKQPDLHEQTVKTGSLKGPGWKAYHFHLIYKTRTSRIVTIIHCVRKLEFFIYTHSVKPILTPLQSHTSDIFACTVGAEGDLFLHFFYTIPYWN